VCRSTSKRDDKDEAARHLDEALALTAVLHEPGQRERYRLLLAQAIELGNQALAAAAGTPPNIDALRSTLIRAHEAKVSDALHGAGQLSLSAQRAPTRDACDEGWQRVEAIIAGAEASAALAAAMAREVARDGPESKLGRSALDAARRAEASARAARRIADERNHAYTFHTDGGFSFGEGWYLAAAAVLAGVTIQIEPGKEGTPRAEAFLRDAGLHGRLQAYRVRPRAMKQTTDLVARAFEADPSSAQQRLRRAFLGEGPIPPALRDWLARRLHGGVPAGKKVLLWIRDGVHHPGRNTSPQELEALAVCVRRVGLVPVLIGDALPDGRVPAGAVDLILFWKDPFFRGVDMRRLQLQFFELLQQDYGVVGQLGATTAGMDGPALLGLPTLYLTDASNVRMRKWVGTVPGYEEMVRDNGYVERVEQVLSRWAKR
jgi:hypothetical protein